MLAMQASFQAHSADLASALTPDMSAAEQHLILGTFAYINQSGSNSTALIEQSGGSFANIDQSGSNNWASVKQSGDQNFANLRQNGNDNLAVANQKGFSNSINLIQNNNDNQFNGQQFGNYNIFNVIQNGSSFVNMSAEGNGNVFMANMPMGTNYSIQIQGDNVKASSVGK